jgi:transposase
MMAENSLFMLTMQGLTLLKKVELFCEENGLRLAPHPLYSPVLAPSDFFVFAYVKEHLKGIGFPSYEGLLDALGEVVTGIESETLTAVFEHWTERLG